MNTKCYLLDDPGSTCGRVVSVLGFHTGGWGSNPGLLFNKKEWIVCFGVRTRAQNSIREAFLFLKKEEFGKIRVDSQTGMPNGGMPTWGNADWEMCQLGEMAD